MASRDPIISTGPSTGSPKRADLLNGSPRTKSAGSSGPNFTATRDMKAGWPKPDSPYGK